MSRARGGVTLVELLVALVILGVVASVTTLVIRPIAKPPVGDPTTAIADSLSVAIIEGRAITLSMRLHGDDVSATVYPDGSAIADSAFHIDRFTGARINAR
jgi:prepilin-type N-terminal cleavage/methylation domain-containing protein